MSETQPVELPPETLAREADATLSVATVLEIVRIVRADMAFGIMPAFCAWEVQQKFGIEWNACHELVRELYKVVRTDDSQQWAAETVRGIMAKGS